MVGRKTLELGAGLGLVGTLVSFLKPATTVISDGDGDCLRRLCDNLERNGMISSSFESNKAAEMAEEGPWSFNRDGSTFVTVRRLLWANDSDVVSTASLAASGTFDLILAADVIYEVIILQFLFRVELLKHNLTI